MTQKSRYERLLKAHESLTNILMQKERKLGKVGRINKGIETILIDATRWNIHRELEKVGKDLGKEKDDVKFDLLIEQGNLKHFGLEDFPILKLPLCMANYISIDKATNKINPFYGKTHSDDQRRHLLKDPNTIPIPFPIGAAVYNEDGILSNVYSGRNPIDLAARWSEKEYIAVVFSVGEHWFHAYRNHPELTWKPQEGRSVLATRLAKDMGLYLFETSYDILHEPLRLECVEVPRDRLEEVATSIRTNPEKYQRV